jgi:hypothetical protein
LRLQNKESSQIAFFHLVICFRIPLSSLSLMIFYCLAEPWFSYSFPY